MDDEDSMEKQCLFAIDCAVEQSNINAAAISTHTQTTLEQSASINCRSEHVHVLVKACAQESDICFCVVAIYCVSFVFMSALHILQPQQVCVGQRYT